MNMIAFKAKTVDSFREEFTDDFVVFSIFFEESDPETGGESWNFQRALGPDGTLESLGEEDEGVCVVKEIQQETFYEDIKSIVLSRNRLVCEFTAERATRLGYSGLHIAFDLPGDKRERLVQMSEFVFLNRQYFRRA